MKPKKTILCVDDNEQALSIRKVLLETRGYRVLAFNNGDQALEAFRRGGIDLVLTDLVMPGVDGSRLIAEVKNLRLRLRQFFSRDESRFTSARPSPIFSFPRACMNLPSCWSAFVCFSCANAAQNATWTFSIGSPICATLAWLSDSPLKN